MNDDLYYAMTMPQRIEHLRHHAFGIRGQERMLAIIFELVVQIADRMDILHELREGEQR